MRHTVVSETAEGSWPKFCWAKSIKNKIFIELKLYASRINFVCFKSRKQIFLVFYLILLWAQSKCTYNKNSVVDLKAKSADPLLWSSYSIARIFSSKITKLVKRPYSRPFLQNVFFKGLLISEDFFSSSGKVRVF